MERFKILKKEYNKDYFSLYIQDNKEDIKFWIDCSLMDGYGNRENYKTEDLYVDWLFNQYIFRLDDVYDMQQQKYQNNEENVEYIQEFLDNNNETLVKEFLERGEK